MTDKVIAYGSSSNDVFLHSTINYSVLDASPLTEANNDTESIDFSPDGRTIAYATLDSEVLLHDTSDWSVLADSPLTEGSELFRVVEFSPDGETIAYAGNDSEVYLHDTSDYSVLPDSPLTQATDFIQDVAFSPDGATIAYAGRDEQVHLHDTSDWSVLGASPLTEATASIWSVDFSPDGNTIAYGGFDEQVHLHDTSDWSVLGASPLTEAPETVSSVEFSPDGSTIAYGSRSPFLDSPDPEVYLHDTSDYSVLPDSPLTQASSSVNSIDFSPDGSTIAYGETGNEVHLHDTSDWSVLGASPLTEAPESVRAVAFSPEISEESDRIPNGKLGTVYCLVQYNGPDSASFGAANLKLTNVDTENVLLDESEDGTTSSYDPGDSQLFIVSETAPEDYDLTNDVIEVDLQISNGDENAKWRVSFGNTLQSDHTHDADPGIIEFPDELPENVDVIVNGETVAENIGTGDFEATVDLTDQLNQGEWNEIDITSETLGHIQAFGNVLAYRQIGQNPDN